MEKERKVALCILLFTLIFRICYFYWMACINNKVNRISRNIKDPTGWHVVLLSIVTCDIYKLFWNYSMGKKIDEAEHNKRGKKGILYLVLGIVSRLLNTIGGISSFIRANEARTKFRLSHPYATRIDLKFKLSPLDIIISLIVLSIEIIIFCLMQKELNKSPESHNE